MIGEEQDTVCIKVSLPQLQSPTSRLLSKSRAVALLGKAEHSDVILQPTSGEFILANSAYLKRNPYFAAQQNFNNQLNNSKSHIINVDPPFAIGFRVVLECIYAHSLVYCQQVFSVNNFVPVFVNAQYLQEENLVQAGVDWFYKNWRTVIKCQMFSCSYIGEDVVSKLLTAFKSDDIDDDQDDRVEVEAQTTVNNDDDSGNTSDDSDGDESDTKKIETMEANNAAAVFNILLAWAKGWDQDASSKELRAFVAKEVNFAKIRSARWTFLSKKYSKVFHLCVTGKEIHSFSIKMQQEANRELYCSSCNRSFKVSDIPTANMPCHHVDLVEEEEL
ncbi:hypothetical protein BCR33DRAFT_857111 [Rhizoclosmatium globosum]|uniref:BTB domain-containing protein n=1 Tax=Rhizoclosmatium globosum TaxID=329046 RepID=A0A1Y2B8J7_9FUNG|nr:hypothetical protein BCR33DRAFT_857111 [Rhizoclosmatium globosum]|eukprot:ORY31149.1 hypothetical protein BCR33DRAFT_857111 [Rhizoclosmatium globosum]